MFASHHLLTFGRVSSAINAELLGMVNSGLTAP
jgi:hypothetical protein